MDVHKLLANPRFRWERKEPAPDASLKALRENGPENLPVTYLRYLTLCDGGGGAIPEEPGTLSLASADQVVELNRASAVPEGYFAFGTGEDTLFLFDLRARDGARVCAVPSDAPDEAGIRELADSFSEFLGHVTLMDGAL